MIEKKELLWNLDEEMYNLQDIKEISSKDIAIIGMDVRLPMADNVHQYWDNLQGAKDCMGSLSKSRMEDIIRYLQLKGEYSDQVKFAKGGYLKEIDKFDNEFFGITKREAQLTDPNQLIFLESAWKAIEDAGYGGNRIVGSNTGVYVGFTTRNEYYQYIKAVAPELLKYADVGNLSSIIASRISYILDLKGPSMVVNTECSSSLVALNLACKCLRNHEIDMAIVGGVRLAFCPSYTENRLGVESFKEKVCAFDDDSDGTVFGEGSVVVVLKNLSKAVQDRDNILAIIKGSCINQDGTTVGITAPNVTAQEAVIMGAWKDAKIEPDTISYIETHGTGTSLGDPVEISGINRAFRAYTDKKMFCGIGSVKTNIGHLDNVSGLASLVKVVLALQNEKIPATLNFGAPNRKINFEESAIYVNNRLRDWKKTNCSRRCGVSSFGLSGTNCHVILEEAPEIRKVIKEKEKYYLFTISACYRDGLVALVKEYINYLKKNTDADLGDICYTVNTGRGHYNFRIAVIAEDREQLERALLYFIQNDEVANNSKNLFYKEHYVITDEKRTPEEGDIYSGQKRKLEHVAESIIDTVLRQDEPSKEQLQSLCDLYVRGVNVNWIKYYSKGVYYKVSLPTYVFKKKRCWLEIEPNSMKESQGNIQISPVIDYRIVESLSQDVYLTHFSVEKHWVLREHQILGKYLAPGTVFLEMIKQCSMISYGWNKIRFRDVVFVNSLIVDELEKRQIQTIIEKGKDEFKFIIAQKQVEFDGTSKWIVFCEGYASNNVEENAKYLSIDSLKQRFEDEVYNSEDGERNENGKDIGLGPRWTRLLQTVHKSNNEILAKLQIPTIYMQDAEQYYLHPSLLDMAINMMSQNLTDDIYLPFSYGDFEVYGEINHKVYSHIILKDFLLNAETITCDIVLYHDDGKVLGKINNVVSKKVNEVSKLKRDEFYGIRYKEKDVTLKTIYHEEPILVFENESEKVSKIVKCLTNSGRRVIHVKPGAFYAKESSTCYRVGNDIESYQKVFQDLQNIKVTQILYLMSIDEKSTETSYDTLENGLANGVYGLFLLAHSLLHLGRCSFKYITIVADYAKYIEETQKSVKPLNNALFALAKVIENEVSGIKCHMLDIDESMKNNEIVDYVNAKIAYSYIAYRSRKFFIEEIECMHLESKHSLNDLLNEEGVYVITGGMGYLGVQLTQLIISQSKAKVVLIGRTEISNNNFGLKNIRDSISYYSADVSDYNQMSLTLEKIREKHGKIRGIFHLAGIVGEGFIKNKSLVNFKKVLLSKVYGTCILYELTENDDLDFFVNYSSVSAIYGFIGQSDYSVANAYMDSFAAYSQLKNRKMLTINWSPWKEGGMAHTSKLSDTGVFKMISSREAFNKLQTVLHNELTNIVIAELDYRALAKYENYCGIGFSDEILCKVAEVSQNSTAKDGRIESEGNISLKGKANGEYSKKERELATIWAKTLGMETVDIYQEFLEIGGDSIQAVELFKRIEEKFPGIISIADVFTYASVKSMAQYIEQQIIKQNATDFQKDISEIKLWTQIPEDERKLYIKSIVNKVRAGTLSVEEAQIALIRE